MGMVVEPGRLALHPIVAYAGLAVRDARQKGRDAFGDKLEHVVGRSRRDRTDEMNIAAGHDSGPSEAVAHPDAEGPRRCKTAVHRKSGGRAADPSIGDGPLVGAVARWEERTVGNECGRTSRSLWLQCN